MKYAIMALLIAVGLLNLAPVVGVVSVARLQAMYGVTVDQGDLGILMRHRALLFGLLGALIIASAFYPALRAAAIIAGFVSMLGFIAIALPAPAFGPAVRNLIVADAIGAGLLIVAVALMAFSRSG